MKFKGLLVVLFAGLVYLPFISNGEDMAALLKKAEQGEVESQYRLGVLYDPNPALNIFDDAPNPAGKNAEEAAKWFKLAAEQGHSDAQVCLGRCYAQGIGVQKDEKEAAKWFRLALEQGNAFAEYSWSLCSPVEYYRSQGNLAELSRHEAEQEVAKARQKAEQGDADAQFHLGLYYDKGAGIWEDDKEAVKWYRLAAEQGLAAAQCALGWCYAFGEGVSRDDNEAVKWFRLAAEQGAAEAQYSLGRAYYSGEGVPQNYATAVKLYRLSAKQGDVNAQAALKDFYLTCIAILIGIAVLLALLFALIRWRARILEGLIRSRKVLSAWGVWVLLVSLYCLLFGKSISMGTVLFPPVALTIIYFWWRWVNKPKLSREKRKK